MFKKAEASFWLAEEIDLLADIVDWTRLSNTKHHFISHVLAFLAAFNGIINENLSSTFTTKVTTPEARCFYTFQIAVKNIKCSLFSLTHTSRIQKRNCTYSVPLKQCHAFNTKTTGLSNGATQPLNDCICCCRSIFFLGSFCAIFWLKKRGLISGLSFSNKLICCDGGLHCNFTCLLYFKQINCLPEEPIIDIISSAVDIEI